MQLYSRLSILNTSVGPCIKAACQRCALQHAIGVFAGATSAFTKRARRACWPIAEFGRWNPGPAAVVGGCATPAPFRATFTTRTDSIANVSSSTCSSRSRLRCRDRGRDWGRDWCSTSIAVIWSCSTPSPFRATLPIGANSITSVTTTTCTCGTWRGSWYSYRRRDRSWEWWRNRSCAIIEFPTNLTLCSVDITKVSKYRPILHVNKVTGWLGIVWTTTVTIRVTACISDLCRDHFSLGHNLNCLPCEGTVVTIFCEECNQILTLHLLKCLMGDVCKVSWILAGAKIITLGGICPWIIVGIVWTAACIRCVMRPWCPKVQDSFWWKKKQENQFSFNIGNIST